MANLVENTVNSTEPANNDGLSTPVQQPLPLAFINGEALIEKPEDLFIPPDALEVIPYTLAENAGLHPIQIVTELRKRHASGEHHYGINVKKGQIADMRKANVWQPLLVSISALKLATETVQMILKIDDMIGVR